MDEPAGHGLVLQAHLEASNGQAEHSQPGPLGDDRLYPIEAHEGGVAHCAVALDVQKIIIKLQNAGIIRYLFIIFLLCKLTNKRGKPTALF